MNTRNLISPYVGETLRGVTRATYLRGEVVFADGEFAAKPKGRDVIGERA